MRKAMLLWALLLSPLYSAALAALALSLLAFDVFWHFWNYVSMIISTYVLSWHCFPLLIAPRLGLCAFYRTLCAALQLWKRLL